MWGGAFNSGFLLVFDMVQDAVGRRRMLGSVQKTPRYDFVFLGGLSRQIGPIS